MFKFTRFGTVKPGRRGVIGSMAVVLAVILALPGVSGALSSGEEHAESSFTLGEVAASIGADALYAQGITGAGVTVAVIDTGVEAVAGLDGENKVIYGPDLSFESGVEELYNHDTFGHGTVMASIIAGNDGVVGGFRGIAPDARILSVKVADNTGAVDVTQVIAALDFVVSTKDETGVRVVNLSYSTPGTQDYRIDPLADAVERAWQAGIVVVVSAGNGGKTGSLSNPAIDPFVIAVASSAEAEQKISDYSSTGGSRNPDFTAPGENVLGLASPYSRLVQDNPTAFIDGRFLRGSGTSQAAAVATGAVALLLEKHSDLTPDQVKAMLMLGVDRSVLDPNPVYGDKETLAVVAPESLSERDMNRLDVNAIVESINAEWSGEWFAGVKLRSTSGVGHLNVERSAGYTPADFEQRHERSDGSGTLEGARGGQYVTMPDGSLLKGEVTFTGSTWSGSTWSGSTWSGSTWSGSSWSGSTWSGSTWSGSTWSGSTWSGSTWSGSSWSGSTWSGSSWSGSSWSGSSWSGSSWSGSSWSGSSWSGLTWQ